MAEISIPYELETPAGTIVWNDGAADGFRMDSVDGLDAPTLRGGVDPVPQGDGAVVLDSFEGPRYPSLTGQIVYSSRQSRRELEDFLRGCARSIKRVDGILRWSPTGAPDRRLTVRVIDQLQIKTTPGMAPKEFLLPLVAGDPTVYSDVEITQDTAALEPGPGAWTFPFVFPFIFGDVAAGGTATIVNGGNAETYPRVRIYGQCTAPTIRNLTTGKLVSLVNLSLSSGDYAEVDMRKETVLLNGDAGTSLFGAVDVPASDFWALEPGPNEIQLNAVQFETGAKATLLWRDGWA